MEYKEGRLGYNRKNDRYGLLVTWILLWEPSTGRNQWGVGRYTHGNGLVYR